VQTIQDVVLRVADEIVLWVHAGFRRLDVAASALGWIPGHNAGSQVATRLICNRSVC